MRVSAEGFMSGTRIVTPRPCSPDHSAGETQWPPSNERPFPATGERLEPSVILNVTAYNASASFVFRDAERVGGASVRGVRIPGRKRSGRRFPELRGPLPA